jgi:hypothetical protein
MVTGVSCSTGCAVVASVPTVVVAGATVVGTGATVVGIGAAVELLSVVVLSSLEELPHPVIVAVNNKTGKKLIYFISVVFKIKTFCKCKADN